MVNGQRVSKSDYEAAVLGPTGKMPGVILPGVTLPVEALIACRNNVGDLQDAVENATGFFLGQPVYRSFGTLLPTGGRAIVFDKKTGVRLREATDTDYQKWRDAWHREVQAAQERK